MCTFVANVVSQLLSILFSFAIMADIYLFNDNVCYSDEFLILERQSLFQFNFFCTSLVSHCCFFKKLFFKNANRSISVASSFTFNKLTSCQKVYIYYPFIFLYVTDQIDYAPSIQCHLLATTKVDFLQDDLSQSPTLHPSQL